MKCELITAQTCDSLRLHGALWRSQTQHPKIDLLIFIHGVGSNFYQSSLVRKIIPPLIDSGISLLSINTRGHDFIFPAGTGHPEPWMGSANEIVHDCTKDIHSWVEKSKRIGFERIGLFGHSLGAIKSIYSQAYQPHAEVAAVIAASPSCLSCSGFQQSHRAEEFLECLNWANREIDAGNQDQISQVSFPFQLMMSPKTFADKYGVNERYNILRFADKVRTPMLLSFGERELRGNNPAFTNLDQLLHPVIQDSPATELRVFPDGDHYYSGLQVELAKCILDWINNNNHLDTA
ncbi:MAG: alpha/beta fold hydrolase [Planctomycetota bacterium]|nr:alpha/beta fold hydrolase [Planctomycetota bacterium]